MAIKQHSLSAYFILLVALCAAVISGAKLLGQQGVYLAQFYMFTPALAALLTRLFFYPPRFSDAHLRLGKLSDYFKYWLISLGITALSYLLYTLLGGITWDFTGDIFLQRLAAQFAAVGQDINATLPPGLTPRTMLLIYFVGGLTVFNLFPGLLSGFGEEFGHRGFMFPQLYRIRPWVGLIGGGLLWYAWHWPLALVIPQTTEYPLWQIALNFGVLGVGSVCAFIYLAYVYIKTQSVWVAALAHITLNNAAAALSYFSIIQNQLLANLGLSLTMLSVVAVLYYKKELNVFAAYFGE